MSPIQQSAIENRITLSKRDDTFYEVTSIFRESRRQRGHSDPAEKYASDELFTDDPDEIYSRLRWSD